MKKCRHCGNNGLFPFCPKCYRNEYGRQFRIRETKEEQLLRLDSDRRQEIIDSRDDESFRQLSKMYNNMIKTNTPVEETLIEHQLREVGGLD